MPKVNMSIQVKRIAWEEKKPKSLYNKSLGQLFPKLMIKLRKDTFSEKKVNKKHHFTAEVTWKASWSFLHKLKNTCKSHLPEAMKIFYEGLNFVREADLNRREYVNDQNLKKHKTNFLKSFTLMFIMTSSYLNPSNGQ